MGIHFITKKRSHREELPIVECALLIVLVPGWNSIPVFIITIAAMSAIGDMTECQRSPT
jgi:hypothetical protein